jgi:hypothetical protein
MLRPRIEFTISQRKASANKRHEIRGFPEKFALHRKTVSRFSKRTTSIMNFLQDDHCGNSIPSGNLIHTDR